MKSKLFVKKSTAKKSRTMITSDLTDVADLNTEIIKEQGMRLADSIRSVQKTSLERLRGRF